MSNTPELCTQFARFVKSKRQEKKIPIKKLVIDSGVSRAFIHLVETQASSPSIETAAKLLKGVGESWDSFIEYTKEAA